MKRTPLLIIGPQSSGKTVLAASIAALFPNEVVRTTDHSDLGHNIREWAKHPDIKLLIIEEVNQFERALAFAELVSNTDTALIITSQTDMVVPDGFNCVIMGI